MACKYFLPFSVLFFFVLFMSSFAVQKLLSLIRSHLFIFAFISIILGEGEGGMIWESSIETCILPYVKQIASPGSMHETGHSEPVHWDDPEGWDGEGGGRGVQDGEHVYTHGWFMSMYGKKHYNIVK